MLAHALTTKLPALIFYLLEESGAGYAPASYAIVGVLTVPPMNLNLKLLTQH